MSNRNTWVLLIQYGCSLGVETTANNLATVCFTEKFGAPSAAALAVASIFGVMNLFARGLGGFLSYCCCAYEVMRGRLICHMICYILEGLTLIVFASFANLAGAVIALAMFSIFAQIAEGSTFDVVPNVNSKVTGSITGIVGLGGNVGGIIFLFLLSQCSCRNDLESLDLSDNQLLFFLFITCTVIIVLWNFFIARE